MYVRKCMLCMSVVIITGFICINNGIVKAGQGKAVYAEDGSVRATLGEGKTGTINWKTKYVMAKGMASAPSGTNNSAQGKALARRGATLDAQRNLLETIKGVHIDSKTVMSDLINISEVLKSEVEGTLLNAEVVKETWNDGVYEVIMQVPIGKIISLCINKKMNAEETVSLTESKYTGIIIDARNMEITPAVYINIYDEKGEKVYGPIHTVYHVSSGSIENREGMRTGKNPLCITAKGTTGSAGVDIVISNEDAEKIKNNILNTDILVKGKVCIVIT